MPPASRHFDDHAETDKNDQPRPAELAAMAIAERRRMT
jgi:hypothetical protein